MSHYRRRDVPPPNFIKGDSMKNLSASEAEKTARKELQDAIRNYNKRLKTRLAVSQYYSIFDHESMKNYKGLSTKKLISAANKLNKKLQGSPNQTTRLVKGAPEFVPIEVKQEMARKAKIANEQTAKFRTNLPKIPRTKFESVAANNLAPLSFGTAQNSEDVLARINALKLRASDTYFIEKGKRFRDNFIKSLEHNYPPEYVEKIKKSLPVDGNQLFLWSLDSEYGDDISIEYQYTEEDAKEKAEKIIHALEVLSARYSDKG